MVELTWFGNATLKIATSGASVIIDPFYTGHPDLPRLWPGDLEGIDGILITHGHFDHARDIPAMLKRVRATAYAPDAVVKKLGGRRRGQTRRIQGVQPHEVQWFGDLRLMPLAASHVRIDLPLVLATFRNMVRPPRRAHLKRLPRLLMEHIAHPEGECLAWEARVGTTSILHFGSLGTEHRECYPHQPDVLSLPMQGNSGIDHLAIDLVSRIQPRSVLVHHFDDAFPPLSQRIVLDSFIDMMRARFPSIAVLVPEYRKPFNVQAGL